MKKLCTALLCGVLTGALPVVSIPDGYSAETQKRETELKTLLRNPGSKEEFTRKLKRLMERQPDEEARLQLLSGQRTYLSPVFQNYLQFAFYELSRTEPEKPLYRLLHLSLIQENGETEDPYLYTLRIADLPSATLLRTAGIVLMRKNLGKKAGEFLEEAYRREPTAVNLQTLALYEHQILQTDRALRRIREAEKRFSSDRDLLILGELLLTLNQPDEALRVLRKSRKQTEDTRKLQAIALFLLHREKEGFELMDRNGLLEMSELTKTTFQSTFLIQLNSLQRRRNNRMVQKFFHSALSVFMPLPILPIPEEFSPLRNLLFRPGFFPAGILEYYLKSSPEEQKRIVETLRKNHWPAPELFLEPERKEQNLARIRKKLENGIPETGELVFYLQNLRVNDLSIPEMERILKAQEQRKLFHPQVLRRYCTMQAVPLERRRKILDSLLKFAGADYVNFTIFPSELQPVITRNMKNILKTMSADERAVVDAYDAYNSALMHGKGQDSCVTASPHTAATPVLDDLRANSAVSGHIPPETYESAADEVRSLAEPSTDPDVTPVPPPVLSKLTVILSNRGTNGMMGELRRIEGVGDPTLADCARLLSELADIARKYPPSKIQKETP